nr:MAG TPA: hypothetical protein [Caudoviricetes sp.]
MGCVTHIRSDTLLRTRRAQLSTPLTTRKEAQ